MGRVYEKRGEVMSTESRELISRFIDVCIDEYDSYAYSAGYLGSLLADVLEQLPDNQARPFIRQMEKKINPN